MKIHTCVRDAKRMELNELEAINRSVISVQANIVEDESESSEVKEVETPKKSRKKKKEEDL